MIFLVIMYAILFLYSAYLYRKYYILQQNLNDFQNIAMNLFADNYDINTTIMQTVNLMRDSMDLRGKITPTNRTNFDNLFEYFDPNEDKPKDGPTTLEDLFKDEDF